MTSWIPFLVSYNSGLGLYTGKSTRVFGSQYHNKYLIYPQVYLKPIIGVSQYGATNP